MSQEEDNNITIINNNSNINSIDNNINNSNLLNLKDDDKTENKIFSLLLEFHPKPLLRLELQKLYNLNLTEFAILIKSLKTKINPDNFDVVGISQRNVVSSITLSDKIFLVRKRSHFNINNSNNTTNTNNNNYTTTNNNYTTTNNNYTNTTNYNNTHMDIENFKILSKISAILFLEGEKMNYNDFINITNIFCSAEKLVELKNSGYFATYKDYLDMDVYITFNWRFRAEFPNFNLTEFLEKNIL